MEKFRNMLSNLNLSPCHSNAAARYKKVWDFKEVKIKRLESELFENKSRFKSLEYKIKQLERRVEYYEGNNFN